jgi:hypothetical protein
MQLSERNPNRHAGRVETRGQTMAEKREPLKSWLEHLVESDAAFKAKVEERLSELRLNDALVQYRKKRGLTQAEMSRIARLSQPYLARLEAGEITNLELKTLVRAATALGLRLKLEFEESEVENEPSEAVTR